MQAASQAVLEASALKLLAETSQRLQILQGNRSEIWYIPCW